MIWVARCCIYERKVVVLCLYPCILHPIERQPTAFLYVDLVRVRERMVTRREVIWSLFSLQVCTYQKIRLLCFVYKD